MIAPPWVPVPPWNYGGTEVVIDTLARGLVRSGHDVVLFASGDSTCPVPRLWHHRTALGTTAHMSGELFHAEAAYTRLPECDVVHDHTLTGPLVACLPEFADIPVVTTAHGPFTPEVRDHFRMVTKRASLITISNSQRTFIPEIPATVIHHGIDVASAPFGLGEGGYALFVGRMSPEKGVHLAIDAAREAGLALRIAAKMWEPDEIEYYKQEVEPRLGPDVTYIGAVTKVQREVLMARAAVLINPIGWPEPFGLVMSESLAAGTPVVALRNGSAPEIIDHGTTGFLCDHATELGGKMLAAMELDRATCRQAALERFSSDRMVRDHVALYRRIMDEHALAEPTVGLPDAAPLPVE